MRGNNRQEIFHSSSDYNDFTQIIQKASSKFSFSLMAYCLLNNQYHLLIRSSEVPIPEIMLFINKTYACHYKKKYKWTGQLYESNFFTSMIRTERELFQLSNLIYEQPRLAGIASNIEDYPYSSFYVPSYSKIPCHQFSFIVLPKKPSGNKSRKTSIRME